MKNLVNVIFFLASLAPFSAHACRELANYPEHIDASDSQVRATYYVVEVTSRSGEVFTGTVRQEFGGGLRVGAKVRVRFAVGEDAHAVCRVQLSPGNTYLLRTTEPSQDIVISAYNWLNVPEGHVRFKTYVSDLASRQNPGGG